MRIPFVIVRYNRVGWFGLKAKLKIIPYENSDVIVATAWPTAYSIYKLSKTKGKKVYFIQDYEIWFGPKDLVDNSYVLDLNRVVSSPYLKELIEGKFGVKVKGIVLNWVDSIFYFDGEKKFEFQYRIIILYHRDARKGYKEGLEVLKMVKQKYPEVEVIIFGVKSPQRGELPSFALFYKGLYGIKLTDLYKSAHIFVSLSLSKDWHSSPMEAMAAKCAVVATSVGSMRYLDISRETALICEPGDVVCLAENLKKLSSNGYNIIRNFLWEISAENFESILKT